MARAEATFVGFCGAGGTGKTSTATRLLQYLPEYRQLLSVSRSVFKQMGVETEQQQDSMTAAERWTLQKAIQTAHLTHQQMHVGQKMLCDRTQMDQVCYAYIQCSQVLGNDDIQWMQSLVRLTLPCYKHIFYFPLTTFDGHDDGMRDLRLGMRSHFDMLLKGCFRHFGVNVTAVPIMSVDDRANFIRNIVENS